MTLTMPCLEKLAKWRLRQCRLRRIGRLAAHRVARLDAIGFAWGGPVCRANRIPEPYHLIWERRIAGLLAFKTRFGHCVVPMKWPEDQALAYWVTARRMEARHGKLLPERRAQLDALGFIWDVKAERRRRAAAGLTLPPRRRERQGSAAKLARD